jgi:uncharacterized protein involved in response to NO
MMMGRQPVPIGFDSFSWHAHEFLFGYLGAVIAGFVLITVPNWIGRLPVMGRPLAGLWVAGRIALRPPRFAVRKAPAQKLKMAA